MGISDWSSDVCSSDLNGAALSEVLDREVNRRNIDVSRGCRVTALHTDEHGCVRGVVLDGETVSANSVIIATGGFGHNRLLLNRHYPEAAQHSDWTWAITEDGRASGRGRSCE